MLNNNDDNRYIQRSTSSHNTIVIDNTKNISNTHLTHSTRIELDNPGNIILYTPKLLITKIKKAE